MKFGLQMVIGPRHLSEIAVMAEEAGFDTLFVPEHLVFPEELASSYPYEEDGLPSLRAGTPCYDPFALLGHLAAATTSVRLATNVAIVPLRHPLFLLRSLSTIDRLSGGRMTLGVGVGWMEAEFRSVGASFGDRGARTDAVLEIMRRWTTDEVLEWHDEHFDFGPVRCNPRPLQPGGIPVHVGGASPRALRRVARFGDGWLEIGSRTLDEVLPRLAAVHAARRDAGRDHLPFEVTTKVLPATAAEMARAEEAGITRISVLPRTEDGSPMTPARFAPWVERFRAQHMELVA